MIAAILCPGPSLARTFDRSFAGVRIGVNRGAHFVQCDYWSAFDLPFLLNHSAGAIGQPRIFTTRATRDSLQNRRHPLAPRITHIAEDLWEYCPAQLSWTLYSATAALVLAGYIGANEIIVYGADFAPGAADYDGVSIAENRTAERFKIEQGIWDNLTAVLAARGVEVRRVLPEQCREPLPVRPR